MEGTHTRAGRWGSRGARLRVALVEADQDLPREMLVCHHVLRTDAVEGRQVACRRGLPDGLRPDVEVLVPPWQITRAQLTNPGWDAIRRGYVKAVVADTCSDSEVLWTALLFRYES